MISVVFHSHEPQIQEPISVSGDNNFERKKTFVFFSFFFDADVGVNLIVCIGRMGLSCLFVTFYAIVVCFK